MDAPAQKGYHQPITLDNAKSVTEHIILGRGVISKLAWAPDQRTLAAASARGIWLCSTGQPDFPPRLLENHAEPISSVAFAPNGTFVASASRNGSVRLWDVLSGEFRDMPPMAGYQLQDVVFSPDGMLLAVGGSDEERNDWGRGRLTLFHVPTATIVASIETAHGISRVLFHPSGQVLAYATLNCEIHLWDVKAQHDSCVLAGEPEEESDWLVAIAFCRDGTGLITLSSLGKQENWDLTGIPAKTVSRLPNRYLRAAAFDSSGQRLAYGMTPVWYAAETMPEGTADFGFDATGQLMITHREHLDAVGIWDWMAQTAPILLPGHSGVIHAVAFSADGQQLASADANTVRIWNLPTRTSRAILHQSSDHVLAVAVNHDATVIATAGSSDHQVRLWDGVAAVERTVLNGHMDTVDTLLLTSNGTLLASAGFEPIIYLWDIHQGVRLATLRGHRERIQTVVMSPDQSILASNGGDNMVGLWDLQTGTQRAMLQGHSDRVTDVAFSPLGTLVASSSRDKTVRLWDGGTGAVVTVLLGHMHEVQTVVFNPSGAILASSDADGILCLWDVETHALWAILREHIRGISEILFSPDGTCLIVVSFDGLLHFWDIELGVVRFVLPGAAPIAFSPDGTLLVSGKGAFNPTICLWDVQTGALVAELRGHALVLKSLVFSADATVLASGGADGTVRLWCVT